MSIINVKSDITGISKSIKQLAEKCDGNESYDLADKLKQVETASSYIAKTDSMKSPFSLGSTRDCTKLLKGALDIAIPTILGVPKIEIPSAMDTLEKSTIGNLKSKIGEVGDAMGESANYLKDKINESKGFSVGGIDVDIKQGASTLYNSAKDSINSAKEKVSIGNMKDKFSSASSDVKNMASKGISDAKSFLSSGDGLDMLKGIASQAACNAIKGGNNKSFAENTVDRITNKCLDNVLDNSMNGALSDIGMTTAEIIRAKNDPDILKSKALALGVDLMSGDVLDVNKLAQHSKKFIKGDKAILYKSALDKISRNKIKTKKIDTEDNPCSKASQNISKNLAKINDLETMKDIAGKGSTIVSSNKKEVKASNIKKEVANLAKPSDFIDKTWFYEIEKVGKTKSASKGYGIDYLEYNSGKKKITSVRLWSKLWTTLTGRYLGGASSYALKEEYDDYYEFIGKKGTDGWEM